MLSCLAVLTIPWELHPSRHVPAPRLLVPAGDSWGQLGPGHPQPSTDPHSIPTASAELLVQDPAGFWQISAASSPFGHNFVFKTSYSPAPSAPWSSATAPALPSLFGGFVLEPFHLWRPNPALSSWMCSMLSVPGVFWVCMDSCLLTSGSSLHSRAVLPALAAVGQREQK